MISSSSAMCCKSFVSIRLLPQKQTIHRMNNRYPTAAFLF